tara:strand:+ start:320 stop:469 length:150 start_codon:yes stop_codon:yes gene_type:complete
MLVDPNYAIKTNITNLEAEEEETSRSHLRKIAVLQRDNEIQEPTKIAMT